MTVKPREGGGTVVTLLIPDSTEEKKGFWIVTFIFLHQGGTGLPPEPPSDAQDWHCYNR